MELALRQRSEVLGEVRKRIGELAISASQPRQGARHLFGGSNWPTGGWPIARSGPASAKARMYLRFEREKPLISGNAAHRLANTPC